MTDLRPANGADRPSTLTEQVQTLIDQGEGSRAAVELLTEAVERQTRAHRTMMVLGGVLALLIVVVLGDNRLQIGQLQHKLCPLVSLSITKPGQAPPSTQHGRDVERAARALARDFGC